MDVLVLIGRILLVNLFIGSAIGHLTKAGAMAGYAEARGVKPAKPLVLISGLLLLAGGLSILLGVYADLGALLLVIFLLPTAVLMHGFWKEADAQTKQMEQIQFNKDLALAGASLMLFVFFASTPDLGLMITGPLFSM